MSVLKGKRKRVMRFLATMLCVVTMLESTDIQVFAETISGKVLNEEEQDISNGNIGSGEGYTSNVTVDEDAATIASGVYCEGITWTLNDAGHLVVEGSPAENVDSSHTAVSRGWLNSDYIEKVISARVNIRGIQSMRSFFEGCSNLESVDFTGCDTSDVTDMKYMFYGCSSLKKLDLSSFDTGNVTTMYMMFAECSSLQDLDLSNFDTGCVANMRGMFDHCSSMETLNISSFNTANVNNMEQMFDYCNNLKALDLRGFDTGNVTNMRAMFYWCNSLQTLDLSSFDTSNVTDMALMFKWCSSLESLEISSFKTSNVADMADMFYACKNLNALDVSGFDTEKVTKMNGMFQNCNSLEVLDVSGFDTGNVDTIYRMFCNDWKLKTLDLSSFDMSKVTNAKEMIKDCLVLESIHTPKNLSEALSLPAKMCDKAGKVYTELPLNLSQSIVLTKIDESEDDSDISGTEDGKDNQGTGTKDGEDKPNPGINDGDDKDKTDTTDGADKPAPDANDGEDKPPLGTNDGEEKPAPGTEDGDDKNDDEKSEEDKWEDVLHDEIIGEFKVSFVRDHVYTGKAVQPKVIVTFGADTLVEGVDYIVSYKNNVNAALAGSSKAPTIIVKGKGNFENSQTVEFNIHAVTMTVENTSVSEMISVHNSKEQTVKPVVSVAGKKLKAGKDYMVTYPDKGKVDGAYKNAGTYRINIQGCGNYQGSLDATMMILGDNQIMASKLKIGKISAYNYVEGAPAAPTPDVMYKKDKLELGKDYTISYKNNDRAGKATLIITGLMNTAEGGTFVAGSVQKTFTIKGTALKKTKTDYNNKVTYTGSAICPAITLTYEGKTLRPGMDYTVKYEKNINVGKGTILLTGQGGYTGTVKKTFTIQADGTIADKLAVSFASGKAEAAYSAKGAKPAVNVTLGDITLKPGKDYTVSYKNNKKLADGNAFKKPVVIIKGKGNYKFTKEVPFIIVRKNMSDMDMNIVSPDVFVGSKKGYLSAPVVMDENSKKLKPGKDYKVLGYAVNGVAFDGIGEVTAGTVITVTVEGMGNYTGQVQTTYRVANNDISKAKTNKPQLEYNGGKVVFTEEMLKAGKLELTDKATGKKLVYGTDFVVTGYKNNTKKGNATVTVQGIGEYGGSKTVKFQIVSKRIEKK